MEINTMNTTRASRPMMTTGIIQGARAVESIYCWACSTLEKVAEFCSASVSAVMVPLRTLFHMVTPLMESVIIWGKRETIPANRITEMPLPMPNSVICSPSHIRNAEPAVKDRTITTPTQMEFRVPPSTRP